MIGSLDTIDAMEPLTRAKRRHGGGEDAAAVDDDEGHTGPSERRESIPTSLIPVK